MPQVSQRIRANANKYSKYRKVATFNSSSPCTWMAAPMGLQLGGNRGNNLGDCWFFLIRYCIFGGFWGFNYSKMAN